MIDETKLRIPCWLVWSTSQNGLVTMEAIGLTKQYAQQARVVLLSSDRNFVQVKIEKSECNHLFAVDLDERWWEMYGEGALERMEQERNKFLKQREVQLEGALKKLWEACALLMPNVKRKTKGFTGVRKVMDDVRHLLR